MSKHTRIAIVGGGLSGLSIAEGLKRKGYHDVTIFEARENVGGKLHSINYNGKSYEMGAIFGLPSYIHLKKMMSRLNIKADGPKLSRINYNADGERTMQIPKKDLGDFIEELHRLPKVLYKYRSLKNANIQNVEYELMIPFADWCDLHHLKVLKTIYVQYFTIFGMGYLDEVPALYVLRIMNYDQLMCFMQVPEFLTWNKGVSHITNTLAKKVDNIRLSQKVKDIAISKDDSLSIKTQYEILEYDKVIISSDLDQFSDLPIWDDDMAYFLKNIKYQYFNVYSFIGDNIPKGCGCVLENLDPDRRGHITIWDARWDLQDTSGMLTLYAYDPKDKDQSPLDLIKEDLVRLGVRDPKLYKAKRWKHCPYTDTEILKKGFYDKMDEYQGKNNIYLAGEIMSALSLENAIWYSEYLTEKFF